MHPAVFQLVSEKVRLSVPRNLLSVLSKLFVSLVFLLFLCQICVAAAVKSFSSERFKTKQSSFVTHSKITFSVGVGCGGGVLSLSGVKIHKMCKEVKYERSSKRSRHGGIALGYFRFLLLGLLIRTSQFKDAARSSGRSLWTDFSPFKSLLFLGVRTGDQLARFSTQSRPLSARRCVRKRYLGKTSIRDVVLPTLTHGRRRPIWVGGPGRLALVPPPFFTSVSRCFIMTTGVRSMSRVWTSQPGISHNPPPP